MILKKKQLQALHKNNKAVTSPAINTTISCFWANKECILSQQTSMYYQVIETTHHPLHVL